MQKIVNKKKKTLAGFSQRGSNLYTDILNMDVIYSISQK